MGDPKKIGFVFQFESESPSVMKLLDFPSELRREAQRKASTFNGTFFTPTAGPAYAPYTLGLL